MSSIKVNEKHRLATKPLSASPRLCLGPGPSNAHPRILQALSYPLIGHLDPEFLELMEETKELLRYVWQTDNEFTVPVSGTGSAAMEACICNMLEPKDKILVCVNGYFGERMCDMASRYGAEVVRVEKPWGEVFTLEELTAAIAQHNPAVVGIVHAETSTGALQPLEGLGDACHAAGALLLVDTVTSIGGVPLFVDAWGIDAVYAGGQKCLNCPPGVSPLSFSPRAIQKLTSRTHPVANWYLDMNMIAKYLVPGGGARAYHHTAPISMNYGFREALRLIAEDGLEARWQQHAETTKFLIEKLAELGISCQVEEKHRLNPLTTAKIPEGIDGKAVCVYLLKNYNIELGGGLGQLAGKVWRIGLMGFNSRKENVLLLVAGLKEALLAQGHKF